jgi:hypothetical protein
MGWNQLAEIKKANAEAAIEERTKELTHCPDDAWELTDTEQGKHCKFCGQVFIK